jgi:hypothetical protein
MSSRSASFAALAVATLATAGGCLKPEDRFDDFVERVVDAGATGGLCESQPVDISGEFLLSISVSISPDTPLRFRCATELVANAALDLQCTPLTVAGGSDIGDPLGQDDIPVEFDGSFVAVIVGTVPGDANPISGSDIVTSDAGLMLSGRSCSADDFCGTVAGTITMPFEGPIDGTFAAVRIAPGLEGDDLPEPVFACPQ